MSRSASPQTPPTPPTSQAPIANYDAEGYDYRTFWRDRDYEHWAERQVLRRSLRRMGWLPWLVDLGAGFGRHTPLYRTYAEHVVLVDYSWTNLTHAEEVFLPRGMVDSGLYLVRANLYALPFRDGAFEMGVSIRVLHHLVAIEAALAEMGRVLRNAWLLDVPSKNHLLAKHRAAARGQLRTLDDRTPRDLGQDGTPYLSFHLDAIRESLVALGWSPQLVASVANLRRWERFCPLRLRGFARPLVYGVELAAQRLGRGWWGPSQWLWLTRQHPLPSTATGAATSTDTRDTPGADGAPPPAWAPLAAKLWCPACHGTLQWTPDEARCTDCDATYRRRGSIWDFVTSTSSGQEATASA